LRNRTHFPRLGSTRKLSQEAGSQEAGSQEAGSQEAGPAAAPVWHREVTWTDPLVVEPKPADIGRAAENGHGR